jgi:hypothetical protein
MFGSARAKATLQGWRPLAEVCRELGQQTLVDNVRDPKLAERSLGAENTKNPLMVAVREWHRRGNAKGRA